MPVPFPGCLRFLGQVIPFDYPIIDAEMSPSTRNDEKRFQLTRTPVNCREIPCTTWGRRSGKWGYLGSEVRAKPVHTCRRWFWLSRLPRGDLSLDRPGPSVGGLWNTGLEPRWRNASGHAAKGNLRPPETSHQVSLLIIVVRAPYNELVASGAILDKTPTHGRRYRPTAAQTHRYQDPAQVNRERRQRFHEIDSLHVCENAKWLRWTRRWTSDALSPLASAPPRSTANNTL
ncbi:hypothetical protein SODALDRAFT_360833 [Sodiomyces alkalinus F11]|uniref:Uncharacterized protein n=1 Tax=Sodiomyces alkalinus (strain CBS 110278 / VKM F-3762 / F11) TaxID=1314773 RepID=A0A3N2PS33_SODAK|nr:hypothetical protein SODALDRAFT_360833 [Sodiomyces alkalinus F11]ROT37146.1 hypothetical protein SODALDRAFT_360833 [Sodiomyces alkalinus F11]